MMRNLVIFFLVFCYWIPGNTQQQATVDTLRYQLETRDGNLFTGHLVSMDSVKIVMSTDQVGVIMVRRDQIILLEPLAGKGQYSKFYNLQSARYLFSPNGYGLRRGEAYYQNVWVLYNQVSFGLTDHVSIGVGTLPIFLFGADVVPVWITPKVSIPISKDQFQLGAGAFIGAIIGDQTGFGIVYGTSTIGSRSKNFTLGLGYGYAGGEWASSPAISISGLLQTGPKGFLITENYFIPTGDSSLGLISLAGRRMIRRVGLDFGGILPLSGDIERLIVVPWLGITIPFYTNKKKS